MKNGLKWGKTEDRESKEAVAEVAKYRCTQWQDGEQRVDLRDRSHGREELITEEVEAVEDFLSSLGNRIDYIITKIWKILGAGTGMKTMHSL